MLNVHVYPSPFQYETRMLKVSKTLVERTVIDRVIFIATAAPGLPDEEAVDDRRICWRIGSRLKGDRFWAKALRFVEWSGRVVWRLRRQRVGMVNCHSLSVLPLCVVLKLWHRCTLVYEPHELETETATFTGLRRRLAKVVERMLIPFAARTIVVSETISEHYCRDYGLDQAPVVRNVPELKGADAPVRSDRLRRLYGIPDNALLFMYQGVLDEVRGARLLLDAFRMVEQDKHILFLGFGPMEDDIKAAAEAETNVHFHPAVKPAEVMEYTLGCDVGFALLDDSCLNHDCALPNKLFHYLCAGLPVVVSDLAEMGRVVDRYRCGWRTQNTAYAIAERIRTISREDVAAGAQGALAARAELNWEKEAERLEAAYADLLPTPAKQEVS